MGYSVDIDTGGTFTDGIFGGGPRMERAKVDTTPHDLTICLLNCIYAGASALGFSTTDEFLKECDIIRWSNTTATNVIAERKGPRVGLFVTDGYEHSLYSGDAESPAFHYLVAPANVAGVAQPVDKEALLLELKSLLEQGVRRICISLKDGLENSEDEVAIKNVFEEQYPDHYLGTVPLLLGSDICKQPHDMTRTHVALLNAYVHGPMAQSMFKAEDDLRYHGFTKPLLIGHRNGGVARVSKTKPVDTIESGPIFGIHAGAYLAEHYEVPNAMTLDVGGTTTKVGLIEDGRPALTKDLDLFGVPLNQPMLTLRSISLGGGTIAKVVDGEVRLGPESMGAYPGPACYDLGGTDATLTDAYLANGFLNPDYFAGGKKRVVLDRSIRSLDDSVAGPLSVGAEEAAARVADRAAELVLEDVLNVKRTFSSRATDHALLAFGGNGGIVAARVAEKAEIRSVYVFDLGSVLSAFGSAVADVAHTYEYSPFLPVSEGEKLDGLVAQMWEEACRDFRGEGFSADEVQAEVEFEVAQTADHHQVEGSVCGFNSRGGVDQGRSASCLADAGVKPDGSVVEIVRLHASVPARKVSLPERALGSADSREAVKGTRPVWWSPAGPVESSIYEWDRLHPGARVEGPAVVEGSDTTYLVPDRWELRIDALGNGLMERR